MAITVSNGRRVPVEFGPYSGLAAIDGDRVLFPGHLARFARVTTGMVDGAAVRVISKGRSAAVPQLVEIVFASEVPGDGQ